MQYTEGNLIILQPGDIKCNNCGLDFHAPITILDIEELLSYSKEREDI